jgi:hypothetical protein
MLPARTIPVVAEVLPSELVTTRTVPMAGNVIPVGSLTVTAAPPERLELVVKTTVMSVFYYTKKLPGVIDMLSTSPGCNY